MITSIVTFLLTILGIAVFTFLVYGALWLFFKWFPATNNIRIWKKYKGRLSFYQSQIRRPIFGWTGFWASKMSGTIHYDTSWTSSKEECERYITIFKDLKNIPQETQE